MNKTVWKIFSSFVLLAGLIATLLLAINFFGFAILGSDTSVSRQNRPRYLLSQISESLVQDETGFSYNGETLPEGYWCILIDETGRVVWEQNKPADVPETYTLNDVARMTKWYLNDYPVYVQTEQSGLLVLGRPKDSVGKYEMEYSMDWFHTLPQRLLGVLVLNLCLAALLAFVFGIQFYRQLRRLMHAISNLRQEKRVQLKERGIFKEICRNLNQTSQTMERKNAALSARDSARSNWISGISHDIRTPLSVITGYSEALSMSGELPEGPRKKAGIILANSLKIKRLIEDLNCISSMEYDMQPSQKVPVKVCPLLRRVVSDSLNNGLPDRFSITLDLKAEKAVVLGDETLLERAVSNLIQNAVQHNPDGCRIQIREEVCGNKVRITIADNGTGVPDDVLENITKIPKTTHGLGLPMAYRIIQVHGGSFQAYQDHGFVVNITLPLQ